MKKVCLAAILGFFTLISCKETRFDHQDHNYGNQQFFTLTHQETVYHIHLLFPPRFDENDAASFPVLLQLDGNEQFNMAVRTSIDLTMNDEIPPMVVVGIGYEDDKAWQKGRWKDYTTDDPEEKNDGGAKEFLHFLESDLIPHLVDQFDLEASQMMISGHSLGGLLATYAWLENPDLFPKGIIASSASLWWNEAELTREATHESQTPIIFTYGTEEGALISAFVEDFCRINQDRGYTVFKHSFENHSHRETKEVSITEGLKKLLN